MVNQDTPEPPADDGYVSRNVYDYDECQSCNWKPTLGDSVLSRHIALSHPEPPADVREALVEAIVEAIEDDTAVGMSTESIVRRAIEGVRRG